MAKVENFEKNSPNDLENDLTARYPRGGGWGGRKDKDSTTPGSGGIRGIPTGYRLDPPEGMGSSTHPVSGLPQDDGFWEDASHGKAILPPGIEHYPSTPLREAPEPDPREYALEGLVPFGAATSLYGDGGVAKSMLAMSLCTSLASGSGEWLGRKITPCSALYLDFELTQDEQVRRTKALCRGSGYQDGVPDNLYYLSALGRDKESVFYSAYHACAWYSVDFLVIDSLGIALHGEAENAGDVISFYKAWLEPFLRQGLAVLLIDHQAKSVGSYQQRTSFGSVYKRNLVRSEIQVEAVGQSEEDGTLDLTFRHYKHNFGPLSRPFAAQLVFREDQVQVNQGDISPYRMMQEQGIPVPDRVMMALESTSDPMTSQDIAEMIGAQHSTVKSNLQRMKNRGKVRESHEKRRGIPMWEVATATFGGPSPVRYDGASDGGADSGEEIVF
jgi:hypothetical protein